MEQSELQRTARLVEMNRERFHEVQERIEQVINVLGEHDVTATILETLSKKDHGSEMKMHVSSTCLDDSSAATPSSESSIAVRASESTSSATSLTRFLNRSKRPMFSPSHPRLVRCQTYRLCVALASILVSLLVLAVVQFRSQAWMVRFEFVLLLLQ